MASQSCRGSLCLRGLSRCSSIAFVLVIECCSAVAQTPSAPISVDITSVPPGADTASILKDKQACDSSSHYDARLFVQCMQARGYSLAVYGPDHKRTSIDELYSAEPGSAGRPQRQQTQQSPTAQSNPPAGGRSVERSGLDESQRQADIRSATQFWGRVMRIPGNQNLANWYQWLKDDPNANGMPAKDAVVKYLELAFIVDTKHFDLDPTSLPIDQRVAGVKRALAWDQERLATLSNNPSASNPMHDYDGSVKADIGHAEGTLSSLENQLNDQAVDAQRRQQIAAQHQVFLQKLPRLLAERKDVGDEVCDTEGNEGSVEEVHGNKIKVATEHSVRSSWGVTLNHWQQYQWLAYNSVYKCEEGE